MLGLICAGLEGAPDAQRALAKAAVLPLLAFFLFEHDLARLRRGPFVILPPHSHFIRRFPIRGANFSDE
jgi:hypothetical protein